MTDEQTKNERPSIIEISNGDLGIVPEKPKNEKGLLVQLALPISILAAALIISGAILITRNSSKSGGDGQEAKADVKIEKDDRSIGSSKAKVTIFEYTDFQCQFCRGFWSNTFSQIKKDYIDTGKVRFVLRHYPLPFHPAAQISAEAVECAADQGKFWEFHDKIFSEQERMGGGTIGYTEADIKKWGREIGLDSEALNSCLSQKKYESKVSRDVDSGNQFGVSGTPTFFINGKKIVGALPFSTFKAAIDEAIKSSSSKFKFW